MELEGIVSKLKEKYPQAIVEATTFREEFTLRLRAEDLLEVCRYLRDDPELSFHFLTDLCGVDRYPAEPRFEVVYHLCAMKTKERLRLKVFLQGESPRLPSVFSIWKAADWLEREVYDMFGITFTGHPDLRRILLTPEWKGHPLRKDYPLQG